MKNDSSQEEDCSAKREHVYDDEKTYLWILGENF
jgi:hypothetical protein